MEEMLAKGRVPAAPIISALLRHLREVNETGDALHVLSEKTGIPFDTLETWVSTCPQSMSFQTADILLCSIEMYHLWYGPLKDIYDNVDLTWRKCACPGCEVWFQFTKAKDPYKRINAKEWDSHAKQYCSTSCKLAANNQKRGLSKTRRKKAGRQGYCWKGHKIVGANALHSVPGRPPVCRECRNSTQRARRANFTEEQKEAMRQHKRNWAARQRIEETAVPSAGVVRQ